MTKELLLAKREEIESIKKEIRKDITAKFLELITLANQVDEPIYLNDDEDQFVVGIYEGENGLIIDSAYND